MVLTSVSGFGDPVVLLAVKRSGLTVCVVYECVVRTKEVNDHPSSGLIHRPRPRSHGRNPERWEVLVP